MLMQSDFCFERQLFCLDRELYYRKMAVVNGVMCALMLFGMVTFDSAVLYLFVACFNSSAIVVSARRSLDWQGLRQGWEELEKHFLANRQ